MQRIGETRDERRIWAILMLGGGHFAGAVFDGGQALVHKTFHCYTVRAKQGGSQSGADQRGGHHKSAGASLRRYNEASLAQHVKEILTSWTEHLKKADLIFYRASNSANKMVLFGGGLIDKKDQRLRTVPFPTKRATFNEVKRIHETLSSVQLHGKADEFVEGQGQSRREKKKPKQQKKQQSRIRRSKSREEIIRELPEIVQKLAQQQSSSSSSDEEISLGMEKVAVSTSHLQEFEVKIDPSPELKLQNDLITACKSGNPRFLPRDLNETSINVQFGATKVTPLHLAAKSGHGNIVKILLNNGADPTLKDKSKKLPYNLCPDKETRNAFRTFRGNNPDLDIDWKVSQIPLPPTEEELKNREEKKKAKRAEQKEKEKVKKAEKAKEKAEEEEKKRFLNLSDREKRALAAEKRMLSQGQSVPVALRCFSCGIDISGKVPFEYRDFKFCSPKCVQSHRKANK